MENSKNSTRNGSAVYYHGTIRQFVPGILKEGLRPHRRNAWNVMWPDDYRTLRELEPVDSVYITQNRELAEHFAVGKADYYRAPYGKITAVGTVKLESRIIPKAKPAVITLVLTPEQEDRLKADIRTYTQGGLKFEGAIPPVQIARRNRRRRTNRKIQLNLFASNSI